MHTMESNGIRFHYNSDLSGDVVIVTKGGVEVEVPGEALVELVGAYVARERVASAEDMTAREALGLVARGRDKR